MTDVPEPLARRDLAVVGELAENREADHEDEAGDEGHSCDEERTVEDPLRRVVHPSPVRHAAGLVVRAVTPAEAVARGDRLEHRRRDHEVHDDAARGHAEGGRGEATLDEEDHDAHEHEPEDDVGQGVVDHGHGSTFPYSVNAGLLPDIDSQS